MNTVQGWRLWEGSDHAPYLISVHDSPVGGPSTHEHEMVYVMGDRIRVVDMRKPAHEGNLIQELTGEAEHFDEVREKPHRFAFTVLSGTHAVVWSMSTILWDRGSGQCVRVFSKPRGEGRSPVFLTDTALIVNRECFSMYDLSASGDAVPLRELERSEYGHLEGSTLTQLYYFSESLYEVRVVDINTGERVRPVMYIPHGGLMCREELFFGMTGKIFGVEFRSHECRMMWLDVISGSLTEVCAEGFEDFGYVAFAPTDSTGTSDWCASGAPRERRTWLS